MTEKKLPSLLDQERLHMWGLIILAVGLSTSNFLMSVGTFWLFGNWLLHNSYPRFTIHHRFIDFFKNKAGMIFLSLFLLHVVGLIYSSDFNYAFKDLRIKLPLFGLPILLSTSPKLGAKRFKTVLYFFIGAVFFASVISFLIYVRAIPSEQYVYDVRDISVFISHIRFSLLICLSIFLVAYLLWVNHTSLKPAYVFLILWFLVILYIMESATGYVILISGTMLILAISAFRSRSWSIRLTALILLVALALGSSYYISSAWNDYHEVHQDISELETYTAGGERYIHDKENYQLENGYYVWLYYAPNELKEAWSERSEISIDSVDAKGQPMVGTIMRYLTSKGLRKDREGVYQLTTNDIAKIESGDPSVKDPGHGLRRRMNAIFFEIDNYLNGGDPSGNSVTQRLVFWTTAAKIIKKNPAIGVGTGDVQTAFEEQYRKDDTKLDRSKWFRSHNQFLTIGVAFGIPGILLFFITIFYPLYLNRELVDYYTIVFVIIACLSFLAEDTLETQAGATFYGFFYSLFVLGRKKGD